MVPGKSTDTAPVAAHARRRSHLLIAPGFRWTLIPSHEWESKLRQARPCTQTFRLHCMTVNLHPLRSVPSPWVSQRVLDCMRDASYAFMSMLPNHFRRPGLCHCSSNASKLPYACLQFLRIVADESSLHCTHMPTLPGCGALPMCCVGALPFPLYAQSSLAGCVVIGDRPEGATCIESVRVALAAASVSDLPDGPTLLAIAVQYVAANWTALQHQVLNAHGDPLSAASTAEEYAAALAGGKALPTEVELAALTHCLAFSVTVYDSTGLQVGYYSSTLAGAEACLVRTTAADGTVAYCPLSITPTTWTGQRRQALVAACRAAGVCMSEEPSVQRAVQVLAILAAMAPATAFTSEHILGEWQAQHTPALQLRRLLETLHMFTAQLASPSSSGLPRQSNQCSVNTAQSICGCSTSSQIRLGDTRITIQLRPIHRPTTAGSLRTSRL